MHSFAYFLLVYIRFSHFSHFLEIENDTIEEPISTLLGVGFSWSPYEEPSLIFGFVYIRFSHFSHFLELENGTIEEPISIFGFVYIRISHFLTFPHISQTRNWHC